jgi:hypothetical protein
MTIIVCYLLFRSTSVQNALDESNISDLSLTALMEMSYLRLCFLSSIIMSNDGIDNHINQAI